MVEEATSCFSVPGAIVGFGFTDYENTYYKNIIYHLYHIHTKTDSEDKIGVYNTVYGVVESAAEKNKVGEGRHCQAL